MGTHEIAGVDFYSLNVDVMLKIFLRKCCENLREFLIIKLSQKNLGKTLRKNWEPCMLSLDNVLRHMESLRDS